MHWDGAELAGMFLVFPEQNQIIKWQRDPKGTLVAGFIIPVNIIFTAGDAV